MNESSLQRAHTVCLFWLQVGITIEGTNCIKIHTYFSTFLLTYLSNATLLYKRLTVLKSTTTLKLGPRDGKGKCRRLLGQWAGQVTNKGVSQVGLERPHPPWGGAAPASAEHSLQRTYVPRDVGSDFSKEDRDADFLIYKY